MLQEEKASSGGWRKQAELEALIVHNNSLVEAAIAHLIDPDSDLGALDSDVGRFCAVDTTGGGSVSAGDSCGTRVDISDTAIRQIFITGRISGSRIIGVIANSAWNRAITDTVSGI